MKLGDIILEADYWSRFKPEAEKLEAELRDTFNNEDIIVQIVAHANGDKAMGKVTIRTNEMLPPSEYQNMKNTLEAKGYEVTGGSNFADQDDDRYFYPDIKFEFKI